MKITAEVTIQLMIFLNSCLRKKDYAFNKFRSNILNLLNIGDNKEN